MGSKVLAASYWSYGPILRTLRIAREIHALPTLAPEEFKMPPPDSPRLNGFSPLNQLVYFAGSEPERVLIVDGNGEHSASEIYSNTLKLANGLANECNVKPCDRVAIMTMSEREMFESFFAIQSIGAIPVPVNIVNSPMTIAFMFADSGADTLIVGRDERLFKGAKRLANFGYLRNVISIGNNSDPRFYNYESLIKSNNELSNGRLITDPYAKAPAILLSTSGTDGSPKGIVMPHENIADATERVSKRFPISPKDVMLFPVPFYHLAGFIVFVGAMKAGCKLVLTDIPQMKKRESTQNAVNAMINNKVTILPGAPLIIERILQKSLNNFKTSGDRRYLFPDLHLIFSGGAPVTPKLIRLVRELNQSRAVFGFNDVVLETFYACTEFGPISSTIGGVDLSGDTDPVKRRYLGVPFDGVEVKTSSAGSLLASTELTPDRYLNRPWLRLKNDDGFVRIGDQVRIDGNNGSSHLFFDAREPVPSEEEDLERANIKGNQTSLKDTQKKLEDMPGLDNVSVFKVLDPNTDTHVICAMIVPSEAILNAINLNNSNAQTQLALEIQKYLLGKDLPQRYCPSIIFFEDTIREKCINGSGKLSRDLVTQFCKKEAKLICDNIAGEDREIGTAGVAVTRFNYLKEPDELDLHTSVTAVNSSPSILPLNSTSPSFLSAETNTGVKSL